MIKLEDGGNSFLDEIDEERGRQVGTTHSGNELNAVYQTNEELLGDLKVKEFDIFEVVINKFNMQSQA